MIRIYPSKLEGEPLETYAIKKPTTINQWLTDKVRGYEWRKSPPISVHVDGEILPPDEWKSCEIDKYSAVDIYPEPKGDSLAFIFRPGPLAKLFGLDKIFQVNTPKAKQNRGVKGDNLEAASLKGNSPKLNGTIREVFGRRKVYPDNLVNIRKYFENKRDQVVETHLCIGVGEYEIPASSILIGETPLISLGDDASYQIYQPGDDVSADPRCDNWVSAPEIGATSTGTAGLELTAVSAIPATPEASLYIFSGDTVTIPSGAGAFPAEWVSGLIVRVIAPYSYTVTEGVGVGVRDIIGGDIAQLGLMAGDQIEVLGTNAGLYVVEEVDDLAGTLTLNYDDGSPVTALVTGSHRMAIGPRGFRYRIVAASAASITLERLASSGATDEDWPGFSDATIDDAVISLDSTNLEGGWVGPFAACPAGEVTNLIEYDVFFPGGLTRISQSDGGLRNYSVIYEVQYRDAQALGAWTSISETITDRTQDQIGFTRQISIPTVYRPEMRMRRIGAKSTSTSISDSIQWYGLRCKLPGKSSYADVTTIAVTAKGGGKLAAQAEQLVSVLATRKLPVRVDGVWTEPQVTRDIAPVVAYIAKSLGYSDTDLDLDELDRLDAIWKARGDTFDQSFESVTTAKDAINAALRAGFAEMTIDRGRIRPVRDEPRTVREQMYTPQNCTAPLTRDFQTVTPDDFDGVDVEYTDGRTWQVETVECRLPGDLGRRVEKIQVEGVTSRTRAWRIGMRVRTAQKYRRYTYGTSTELDALNSRYLSYVVMADDVPGYGKSAILENFVAGNGMVLLQSSEPFTWVPGASHVVGIRRPDGTLSGPYAATRIDDYRLTIPSIDFTPDVSWNIEPPHLLFGTTERWAYPALVTDISPGGDNTVSIKAINYAPEVYQFDDSEPPS